MHTPSVTNQQNGAQQDRRFGPLDHVAEVHARMGIRRSSATPSSGLCGSSEPRIAYNVGDENGDEFADLGHRGSVAKA